jgi:antitoxin VapB
MLFLGRQFLPRNNVSLNIKDPREHDLAQAHARETGESMTLAVIEALTERLARIQRSRRNVSAQELLAIGQRCAQSLTLPVIAPGGLLYDERGLPHLGYQIR